MVLPCRHATPRDGCRICWLSQNDERYTKLWSADLTQRKVVYDPAPNTTPDRAPAVTPDQLEMLKRIKLHMSSPCAHLGEALEERPSCGCGGTLAIKHGCSVHGQCRISSRDKALPNCIDCDSYAPRVL